MSSARWLCNEVTNELTARKSSLLAEKAQLQKAAARILEIDETVELIDRELASQTAKLAQMPEESVDAKPAA